MSSIPPVPEKVKVNTRAVLLSSKNGVVLKRFNLDYKTLVGSAFPWKQCGFPSPVAMLQCMRDVVRFQYSLRDGDYRLYGIGTEDMFMPSWVKKAQGLSQNNGVSPNQRFTTTNRNFAMKGNARSPLKGAQSSDRRPPNTRSMTCPPVQRTPVRAPPPLIATPPPPLIATPPPMPMLPPMVLSTVAFSSTGKTSIFPGGPGTSAPLTTGVHATLPLTNGVTVKQHTPLISRELMYSLRGLVTVFFGWTPSEVTEGVMEETLTRLLNQFVPPPVEIVFQQGKGFVRYSEISDAERVIAHFKGMVLCGTTLRAEPAHEKCPQKCHSEGVGLADEKCRRCGREGVACCIEERTGRDQSHDWNGSDQRVEQRFRSLITELALSDDDDDDDSLVDFEWDDSLLDEVIAGSLPPSGHRESSAPGCGLVSHAPPTYGYLMSDSSSNSLQQSSLSSTNSISTPTVEASPPPLTGPEGASPPPLTMDTPPPLSSGETTPPPLSDESSPFSEYKPRPLHTECPAEMEGGENDLIAVTIARVVSPSELWIQLTSDPDRKLRDISEWIVNEDPPKLKTVKLGGVCCMDLNTYGTVLPRRQAPPPRMRRAVVCDNEEKHVSVPQVGLFLIDMGIRKESPVKDLLTLPLSLHPEVVPPLSSPCALQGLVSTYNSPNTWSSLDIQLAWKHLQGKQVFIRRQSGGGRKGCDLVEMYFDPSGKDSVVERILEEGYHVARGRDLEVGQESCGEDGDIGAAPQGDEGGIRGRMGTKMSKPSESGLESGSGNGNEMEWCTLENGNGTEWCTLEEFDVPSACVVPTRRRGLMSMVTSALKQLEMESKNSE